jgi:hypothetical protein
VRVPRNKAGRIMSVGGKPVKAAAGTRFLVPNEGLGLRGRAPRACARSSPPVGFFDDKSGG